MTDNEIIAQLQKLARGRAGYDFRRQLRDRYRNAFGAANKTKTCRSYHISTGGGNFLSVGAIEQQSLYV